MRIQFGSRSRRPATAWSSRSRRVWFSDWEPDARAHWYRRGMVAERTGSEHSAGSHPSLEHTVDPVDHRIPATAPARPRGSFPPVAAVAALDDQAAPSARWTGPRLRMRVRGDVQLLLSIAVALPVLAMEGISDVPQRPIGLLGPVVFVVAQFWLTTLRGAPAWLPTARLGLCLVFIALANLWIDPSGTWPLSALAIPVV